ncbi:hypothetical protein KC959_04145, partial [Candidatus Saccharibacteria bacterium]|nr:hypothetical protein [Candidatus Saccharibacteria bacterium]
KALILRADLWHGNAEDSWDSGWDQHSYSARDSSQKIALLKPIDEWGVSVHRGHYDVSLREDPHFLYNGDLYQADVLLQRRSLYTPLTATLGKTLVRVDRSEDSRGYPAYSFDYQIEPHHNVYAMHYFVLDSYSSV